MSNFKFVITLIAEGAKLFILSFREDGSFASGSGKFFSGVTSVDEVVSYGKELLENKDAAVEVIISNEGLTSELENYISHIQIEEENIKDDPSTTVDESIITEETPSTVGGATQPQAE